MEEVEQVLEGGLIALYALVHIFAGKLRFLQGIPRSRWLSIAGGCSVAYVFLHLLPEIAAGSRHLNEDWLWGGFESALFLLALVGLVVFYGLDRLAIKRGAAGPNEKEEPRVFWVHLGSLGFYNILIAYLTTHSQLDTQGLALFGVAMGLHLLVSDFGVWSDYGSQYLKVGRWLLVGSVFTGGVLGWSVALPEWLTACITAVLGGGVILNVLREELPRERESRFTAFLAGLILYSGLLFLMDK